jgi:hypothetical protein
MSRPAVPKRLQQKLLYDSQYVCAVCQSDGCHIHHIDQNHSNNIEENLIVLCVSHHNEAHTKRDHSRNLDSAALRDAKQKWTTAVQAKREKTATVAGQKEAAKSDSLRAIGLTWGYINHQRVIQMVDLERLDSVGKQLLDYCRAKGIVDSEGIIIKPARITQGGSPLQNTIYDWFEYGDDQRLHLLYTKFVDQIGGAAKVVHLEPQSWSPTAAVELVQPGTLIFVTRSFYFKTVSSTTESDHVGCKSAKDGLSLEFFVDTINMFGTTSITVSFTGRQTCAALVLVKSIDSSSDGNVLISATPIALGVGFEKHLK